MKKDNVQLTTAGILLKDLKRYEKKHWGLCVVAWMADEDRTFGVVGTREDKDGDFQIVVEEIDEVLEGFWTVADVIDSLEDIGKEKRVYMAGDGSYFAIDSNGDIFTEADDDDAVGCWVTVFGEYEEVEHVEKEESRIVDDARPKSWKGVLKVFTYLLVSSLCVYGLYYNMAALVKNSGAVWESALWIPFLLLLLWVCIDGLFRLHTID